MIDPGILEPPHPPSRLDALRERYREPSLTILLVLQCVTVFGLVPANAAGLPLPSIVVAGMLTALLTLAFLISRGRWTLIAGVATLLLAGSAVVLEAGQDRPVAPIVTDLIGAMIFVMLSTVVSQAVFGPGRFSGHRIQGAVGLYLNIGMLFTFLHRLVAELAPGAYANLPDPETGAAFRAAAVYFSFSTLTSVGYGDIVPIHPFARSLATLEAMLGQLLPATLLARVVTLAMRARGE